MKNGQEVLGQIGNQLKFIIMKYRIINDKTNKVEWELFSWEEASELVDMEKESIIQVFECRECSNDADERHDAYGISTGYWCDACYHSNKYPYRKDAYETIERHGRGERLDDESRHWNNLSTYNERFSDY